MGTAWQPLTWNVFHTIALNYNESYKNEYINFFNCLKVCIPCRICRNHYIQQIKNDNMVIENNINEERIFNWTVDLHNTVNKMNHKRIWSYDEAKNYYQKHNFNNNVYKHYIYEYIKSNFKKNPEKTNELLKMIQTLVYFHPNEKTRNKLIDFKSKFELSRQNIKSWVYAFLIILKS